MYNNKAQVNPDKKTREEYGSFCGGRGKKLQIKDKNSL